MSDSPAPPSPDAHAAATAGGNDVGRSAAPIPLEFLEWNRPSVDSSFDSAFEQAASLYSSEGLGIMTELSALAQAEQSVYDQYFEPSHGYGYDSQPWSSTHGYDPQTASSFEYDLQQSSTQRYDSQPGSSFGHGYNTQPGFLFGCNIQPSSSLGHDAQPGTTLQCNSQPDSYCGHNMHQGSASGYGLQQGASQGNSTQLGQQATTSQQHGGQLGSCASPSLAPETSSRRRSRYRHRHTRQFLENDDQRAERTRILNNEASALYRANVRASYEQAQRELEELESRHQQLTDRYRLLRRLRDGCRRILVEMDVPVPHT